MSALTHNEKTTPTTRIYSAALSCSVSTGCRQPLDTLTGDNYDTIGLLDSKFTIPPPKVTSGEVSALLGAGVANNKPLSYFDFAPMVAPTTDQLMPHLVTETVFVASRGDSPIVDAKYDWIMDTGCTSHMCNNPDLFIDLKPMQLQITAAGPPTKVTSFAKVLMFPLPQKPCSNSFPG